MSKDEKKNQLLLYTYIMHDQHIISVSHTHSTMKSQNVLNRLLVMI